MVYTTGFQFMALPARNVIVPTHTQPEQDTAQPPSRKRLVLFAVGLVALSAFMYFSIIIKTAMMGP
jgi:hypothetical protein